MFNKIKKIKEEGNRGRRFRGREQESRCKRGGAREDERTRERSRDFKKEFQVWKHVRTRCNESRSLPNCSNFEILDFWMFSREI